MSKKLKMGKGKKRKTGGFSAAPSGAMNSLFHTALHHHQAGEIEQAEKLYRQVVKNSPGFVDAWNNLGAALMARGKLQEAEQAYRKALLRNQNIPQVHYNLGLALRDQNKISSAVKSFENTLRLDACHTEALLSLGNLAFERRDLAGAISFSRRAVECAPASPDALFQLALAFHESGNLDEAEQCYCRAAEMSPGYPDLDNNLANVYALQGDFAKAEVYYRKALALEPESVRAMSNFAEMLEKENRLDEAGQLVEASLALDENWLPSRRLKATLLRREGKPEKGLKLLEDAAVPDGQTGLAIEINSELAKLHDRAGNTAQAFHYFSEVNNLQKAGIAGTTIRPENFIEQTGKISEVFSEGPIPVEGDEAGESAREDKPVFLVGFPRSGTTLLDQVLDSHPEFKVAEETPVLNEVIDSLSTGSRHYPEILQSVNGREIDRAARDYKNGLLAMFPEHRGVIVDKYPLHLIHLGLINMMFPQAKIIFAVRHPYDVCLSCFMQLFRLNDSMANFFTMESTAACYAKVMALWQQYERILQLDVHKIRYEDLVGDFEGEVRGLLAFLDVDWDESVLEFHRHAKKRGPIMTPSYQQVTEKIYTRAAGRWQRYEEFFLPVRETLAPFVEYFGY